MDYYDYDQETGGCEPVSFNETDPAEPETEKRREKRGRRHSFLKGLICGVLIMLALGVLPRISITIGSGSGDTSEAISASTVLDSDARTKVETLLTLLESDYYRYDDLTVEELQEGIYSGLLEGLDDSYSAYYTVEEMENYTIDTTGSYSGIGAVITVDSETDWPMVAYTYEGSPAEEAGLQTGDLFLQIDDAEVTSDMDTSDVASMIRGDAGTSVHIIVQRNSEEIEFDITRADIETPTVESQMLSDGVGYIYILQFSDNTAEQFSEAYDALTEEGMSSLIIDLRYNGGGLVSSCVEIMDYILPEGVTLTMEDAAGDVVEYTSDAENYIDLPIAVLINGSSASASEILVAALKDYDYATVIGTTTYGKGVYQQMYTLTDGSGVKITNGEFFSPDGNNYDGVGIDPDIELEYEFLGDEDADYSVEYDNQIQKAVEVLTEEAQ